MKGEAVKAVQKIHRPQRGQCTPSGLRYGPLWLRDRNQPTVCPETVNSRPKRAGIASVLWMVGWVM
jgi:hypothetical protein